jgi:hypothetical protein
MAVGEQAIMPDLYKSGRQYMQQEATDELDRLQGHELLGVVVGRIAPAEGDLAVGEEISRPLEMAMRWV